MWRAHQNEAIRVMGSDFKTINYAQRRKKPKKEQFWACPSKIEGKVTRTGQFWLQIRNLRQNCGLGSLTPILFANFRFSSIFLPQHKNAAQAEIGEKSKFSHALDFGLPRPQFWRRFRIWSQNWPVIVTLPSILLGHGWERATRCPKVQKQAQIWW